MFGRVLAVVLSWLVAHSSAYGSAILPLDTFPDDGDPFGGAYQVAASFEWQEIAVPFHIAAAGHVTRIDTGLFYGRGLSPLLLGIGRDPLIGSSFPDTVFDQAICSTEPMLQNEANYCVQDYGYLEPVTLAPGELFSWTGSLFLEAGDYWLYGSLRGDAVWGGWYSNPSLLTDDWATRSCALSVEQGTGCAWEDATWASVSEYGYEPGLGQGMTGGGSYATPVARIYFEPGLRINEPGSLALLGLGLGGLAFTRRRRQQSIS